MAKTSMKAVIAAAAVMMAAVTASAATTIKHPTYYMYKKCASPFLCQGLAATNATSSKVVSLQFAPKCRLKKSRILAYNGQKYGVTKGVFTAKMNLTSSDEGMTEAVKAKVTIRGAVVKKVRIRLDYTIVGDLAAGCTNVKKTGTMMLPFKGAQSGG